MWYPHPKIDSLAHLLHLIVRVSKESWISFDLSPKNRSVYAIIFSNLENSQQNQNYLYTYLQPLTYNSIDLSEINSLQTGSQCQAGKQVQLRHNSKPWFLATHGLQLTKAMMSCRLVYSILHLFHSPEEEIRNICVALIILFSCCCYSKRFPPILSIVGHKTP